MDFGVILENFTIGLTLILHLSGLSSCQNMMKTKSTQGVPYLIFILSAISCLIMIKYAGLVNNQKLIYLNVIGLGLYVLYIVIYLAFSKNKQYNLVILATSVAILGSHFFYLFGIIPDQTSEILNSLGIALTIVTLLVIFVPAFEVYYNLKEKHSKGMPLVMILASLACGTSWFAYGLMLNDVYIYMPNSLGVTIGLLKLFAFVNYGVKEKLDKKLE